MNIANLLAEAARTKPAHDALVFEGRTYSYDELDRLTSRFAHALAEHGVSKGDVLAIYLESCPELVIAYLGALKAGVAPNVVNGFLKPEEVRHVVADSGAKLIVTDSDRHEALAPMADAMGTERAVVTGWRMSARTWRLTDS